MVGFDGRNALHVAILNKNLNLVEFLIETGTVDCMLKDCLGFDARSLMKNVDYWEREETRILKLMEESGGNRQLSCDWD